MVERDVTKATEFTKRKGLEEPSSILKQTNVQEEAVEQTRRSEPSQQQQQEQDKGQEKIRRVLEENLGNKELGDKSKMKYDYQISGSDRILLSCPDVNFFTVFQKLEEPMDREEEKKPQELPSDQQQPQQRVQDESAVSGMEQEVSPIRLTEQHVKCITDSMIRTSQRIKNMTLKLQVAPNIHEIFESFSNRKFSFKFNPITETMVFGRKTTEYPLEFATVFIPNDPSLLRDRHHSSRIYTSIEPYARSWINKEENIQYIQLMAIIKCGWNIRTGDTPWTEPTRVKVSVHPETQGSCTLVTDSTPSTKPFAVTERMEVTTRRLKDKGITVDSKIQVGGGPTGGTLTTPSIVINHNVKDEQELKKLDIEVNKTEFDYSLHSDLNCVSWLLNRRYSRMRDRALNRIDLALYDPSQPLSRDEFEKIKLEEANEPFSDYVNFGVWKWDRQKVTFEFEVEHGYRHIMRTRQLLQVHSKYVTCEQNNIVGRGEFPIEQQFNM